MGLTIITPTNAFIRFDGELTVAHCVHGEFKTCLPVYGEDDIAFQFVVQADTEAEAAALCNPYEIGLTMGIVRECDQEVYDVEFEEIPERYRISDLQVLYNWPHGLPGMIGNIEIGECFRVRVQVGESLTGCTNCFQRIDDPCFTSVVEYGNNENFAGFNYCNSGEVDPGGSATCDPEVYAFTNKETLVIPYTASLQAKFGQVPTVQVWIYDGSGNLVNMGVVAQFDAMPPTTITVDFGGTASGIVVIR